MAYLDIWDIISDRGFWEGVGSGEEVNGRLGFMRLLGGLAGGAEELLRGPLGGRAPCSMLPRVVEEFMLRGGCLFWGTPGLGMAVLGEATQPGEGTATEGDLSLLGEPVGERTLREELRTCGDLRGPGGLAEGKGTICEGVWGDLRLAEGEVTRGECTWLRVGDFRCPMPGEPI